MYILCHLASYLPYTVCYAACEELQVKPGNIDLVQTLADPGLPYAYAQSYFLRPCCSYTSFSELYPLLAASNLPGIEVGEISQSIDTYGFTATNTVQYKGPLGSNSFSVTAAIEVRSPKRIQVSTGP